MLQYYLDAYQTLSGILYSIFFCKFILLFYSSYLNTSVVIQRSETLCLAVLQREFQQPLVLQWVGYSSVWKREQAFGTRHSPGEL